LAEAKKTNTEEKDDFRYIVRIVNTDIDGKKPTVVALQSIKGVGKRVAEVVVRKAGVDRLIRIGDLDEATTDELAKLIASYSDYAPTGPSTARPTTRPARTSTSWAWTWRSS